MNWNDYNRLMESTVGVKPRQILDCHECLMMYLYPTTYYIHARHTSDNVQINFCLTCSSLKHDENNKHQAEALQRSHMQLPRPSLHVRMSEVPKLAHLEQAYDRLRRQEQVLIKVDSEIELNSSNFRYDIMRLGYDRFSEWLATLPAEHRIDRQTTFTKKFWTELMQTINEKFGIVEDPDFIPQKAKKKLKTEQSTPSKTEPVPPKTPQMDPQVLLKEIDHYMQLINDVAKSRLNHMLTDHPRLRKNSKIKTYQKQGNYNEAIKVAEQAIQEQKGL